MNVFDSRNILFLPEIAGLDARSALVRIPPELDVPLTPRVRRLVDSRAFQRLAQTSQLGFVRLVYPGATHSRFEHSLGVYRLSLLMLKRLAHESRFAATVRPNEAKILILTALLHDVGHFPYCHLLEDLKLPGLPTHEEAAGEFLRGELANAIRNDWNVDPENVVDVLLRRTPRRLDAESDAEFSRRSKVFRLLSSVLSGPIDVDKMDYLLRDSCAAGVPYGRNYDLDRLIGSVCLNENGDGIAISTKGKTAAELMVFARYVMFSEVYWHHAARSATVMFQRAVDYLAQDVGADRLARDFRRLSDSELQTYLFALCRSKRSRSDDAPIFDALAQTFADELDDPNDFSDFSDKIRENKEKNESPQNAASSSDVRRRDARRLLLGLFGPERKLYKRIVQFGTMEEPRLYPKLSGRPYFELREISNRLAAALGLPGYRLLIDAPPVDKEVEFKIDVFYPEENVYRPLSSVSPVVRALAQEQFDDYVKRVRVFAAQQDAPQLKKIPQFNELFNRVVDEFDADSARAAR